MHRFLFVFILTLLASSTTFATSKTIRVRARLIHLPKSERCKLPQIIWVRARYKIEVSNHNSLKKDQEIIVEHACPEIPRGFGHVAKGNASRLKPGTIHLLSLIESPKDKTIYRATRTDKIEEPAEMVVTVNGKGIQHKYEFQKERIYVGTTYKADLRLKSPQKALYAEIYLVRDKESQKSVAWIKPQGPTPIFVDKKKIQSATKLSYKKKIIIDGYTLFVLVKE